MKTCHVPALLILTLFANGGAFDVPRQRAAEQLSILPRRLRPMLIPAMLLCVFCFAELIPSASHAGESNPAVGPSSVIVHSKFGGQIFGFDIDPNGKDGILSESLSLPDGNYLAAVETFDQTTGEIIKVISMTKSQDDFVTLGVFNSVGLIESEHVVGFLDVRRKFHSIAPLDANEFTGVWTPPIDQEHLVTKVSGVLTRVGRARARVASGSAVYVMDNSGSFTPLVFTSDVRSNTFGPVIGITDENFTSGGDPGFAYDNRTNQAVLGHSFLGNPFVPGFIATVDLTTGVFSRFRGVGIGDVNGLAVDPATGTACTTTEIDFSVQFYDLATQTGFSQPLPGALNQFFSGADVEFDPVNKLFLVAQPNSSTASSGSSIHVYDVDGNLVESLNGFNFSNAGNVIFAHIALNPSRRSGFVDGPDPGVTQIQSFTY
jgi:hypothetical protein